MSRLQVKHVFFFFNDTATTEIYTLSLHDALPICRFHRPGQQLQSGVRRWSDCGRRFGSADAGGVCGSAWGERGAANRSEEHTSELQSQSNLVCRLLLEKKKLRPNPSSHDCRACVP